MIRPDYLRATNGLKHDHSGPTRRAGSRLRLTRPCLVGLLARLGQGSEPSPLARGLIARGFRTSGMIVRVVESPQLHTMPEAHTITAAMRLRAVHQDAPGLMAGGFRT